MNFFNHFSRFFDKLESGAKRALSSKTTYDRQEFLKGQERLKRLGNTPGARPRHGKFKDEPRGRFQK